MSDPVSCNGDIIPDPDQSSGDVTPDPAAYASYVTPNPVPSVANSTTTAGAASTVDDVTSAPSSAANDVIPVPASAGQSLVYPSPFVHYLTTKADATLPAGALTPAPLDRDVTAADDLTPAPLDHDVTATDVTPAPPVRDVTTTYDVTPAPLDHDVTPAPLDHDVTPAPLDHDVTATDDVIPASFAAPPGFADRAAAACYAQFARLPRRARPQAGREWTLMAGVLLSDPPHADPVPVALGTGSKCLGASQRSAGGESVADSHAEVVARRAFRRFLLAEVRRLCTGDGESRWLRWDGDGAALGDGVRVHFFTSHTPCGDCSIFPRACVAEDGGGAPAKRARLAEDGSDIYRGREEAAVEGNVDVGEIVDEPAARDAADIYRTGAKPVVGEAADPRRPGAGYHVTGVLRTKPGRGEPTLSMSCSDKLARWLRVGLQGALLSCWLPAPLPLSAVVTGGCPFSAAAMRRALLRRPALLSAPLVAQSALEFEFGREAVTRRAGGAGGRDPGRTGVETPQVGDGGGAVRVVPSPCSVAWSRGCPRELEVSVEGIRQGVTKKARGTAAARVAICRREVMQEFVQLARDVAPEQLPDALRSVGPGLEGFSYKEVKSIAKGYVKRWRRVRRDVFPNWTEKPSHLMNFRMSD